MSGIGFVTRRRFLGEVGAGMLLAGLGPEVLCALDLPAPRLDRDDDRLDFGTLEPLVRLMQETPADKILAACVEKLRSGTALDKLIAAAALANARTFGGEDYIGYHCEMALMPARFMASRMPDPRLAALPVLKVIHRNTTRIHEKGGREHEVLRRLPKAAPSAADPAPLLAAERKGDVAAAEAAFGGLVSQFVDVAGRPELVFNAMQELIRDHIDVHQVVLAWRAYDLRTVTGPEHMHTLLRQSVRHCVMNEAGRVRDGSASPSIRDLLPRLIDEHRLSMGAPPRSEPPVPDASIDAMARTIFSATRDEAARAVAAALRAEFGFLATRDAIMLASVRLLLHDPGQTKESTGKPVGSVHGASIGVHGSDSAHAWTRIAEATTCPVTAATLVTAAWHTAGQSGRMDRENPVHASARPRAKAVAAKDIPGAIEESIRGRDQAASAALVERYGALGLDPAPLIEKLLAHAVEHDGALHHEKFFATAVEGFAEARPAFRFEYLAALTRVLASGYGFEAPGLKEARERLLA